VIIVRKRSTFAIVAVVVIAVAMWVGGRLLWHALLAMHGQ
jgi:hypothetical protein